MPNQSNPPQRTWNLGLTLLSLTPFLGLVTVVTDPPTWVEVVIVVAIIAMVATGSTLMRRRTGGWRPSESTARPDESGR